MYMCIAYKMPLVPDTAGVPIRLYLASPRHSKHMEVNGQIAISTQYTVHGKPFCTDIRASQSSL